MKLIKVHIFYLYLYSSYFERIGLRSSSTFLKSLKFILRNYDFCIVLNIGAYNYRRGIMLVSAIILRISLAE